MSLSAGVGKHETTCFIPGIGMMGYGQPHNTVKEVATPLYARCLFLRDENQNHFVLVHLEQAFVSIAIKEEIVKRLSQKHPEWKLTDSSVMITAQHTHSAPGGYSHYPFYNFTIPGFQLKVFDTVCEGIICAIEAASKNIEPAHLKIGQHQIPEDKKVAFNRSLEAFNNNEDADQFGAVDRQMIGLSVHTKEGKPKAILNWFGVHCTSISSFNHRIHHDNKGVAADLYEKNHPGVTAFFLQSAAGDISPNYIWDPELKRNRGTYKDQYENAESNGEIQFREAEKIDFSLSIEGEIKTFSQFFDMNMAVAPAAHGVSFFEGTKEGPGVPKALAQILKVISRGVKYNSLFKDPENKKFYEAHFPKDVLLDHRNGSFLGMPLKLWKKLPPIPDPTVEAFRKEAKNESINTTPWVPEILPFQIIVIGPLLIAAVPGEITTMAARRLKKFIEEKLAGSAITDIVISSYANAYMGYITTPEEYFTQCYEGGHTVYGHGTLRGICSGFEEVLNQFIDKSPKSSKNGPYHFPPEELALRSVPK